MRRQPVRVVTKSCYKTGMVTYRILVNIPLSKGSGILDLSLHEMRATTAAGSVVCSAGSRTGFVGDGRLFITVSLTGSILFAMLASAHSK